MAGRAVEIAGPMRALLLTLTVLLPQSSSAQPDTVPPGAPRAGRVSSGRIAVDGRPLEPAWATATPITDFRQHDPAVGEPATERTEVRVLFDSGTVYVSVAAFDTRPTGIIARILARDRLMAVDDFSGQLNFASDDAVAILLDPFRDRRNALVFATNANGAEFEAQITDQGREVNVAWRTVWRVAAVRNDSGWSAEFAIPLRSIRHPDDGRPWGLNVYRVIRRKNEHVMWRSWSRDNAGFLKVSEAGEVAGISELARTGLGLEVKTSAITRAARGEVDGRTTPLDGSVDLKYEMRPGVTLDVTANTDFAQADVDDVQINLTRFDLFFPEKRDFFLENAGVFEFGTRGLFEPPPWLMFFSRRIGISDSGEVPVLGGLRLTGREGAQTFGLLHMQTDASPFERRKGYSAARFKRDVGNGYVGVMYAGLNASGAPAAESYGLDFQAWPGRTLNIQGFVAGVRDSANSSLLPRSSSRAYRVSADKQLEHWGLRIERMVFGEFAEPPVGFATRLNLQRNDLMLRLTFTPSLPGVRRVEAFTFANYSARTDGALQDWGVGPAFNVQFNSGDGVTFFRLQAFTVLDESFDLADRLTVQPGRFANSQTGLFIETARHRPVRLNANAQYQPFYGGTLTVVQGTLDVAVGARGTIALTRAFNDARMPAGHLVTNVSALRLGYAFSTRSTLATVLQYDALDRVTSANLRFAYQYRPGSEVFFVLDGENDPAELPASRPRSALVKLTYLARL